METLNSLWTPAVVVPIVSGVLTVATLWIKLHYASVALTRQLDKHAVNVQNQITGVARQMLKARPAEPQN